MLPRFSLITLLAVASVGCGLRPQQPPKADATPLPIAMPGARDSPGAPTPLAAMAAQADGLDPHVLALALQAQECAVMRGAAARPQRLAVIDYRLPSTRPRLWVFDIDRGQLLFAEHVAHGKGSGENMATRFSNRDGSLESSLGLFATAETYDGGNGYSLRMDGLEAGINDHARDRLLVMHGAPYVDPAQALRQGRLGRSWGCPALRPSIARSLIDSLRHGQLVFAYYPDAQWLQGSRFLHCAPASAGIAAAR